MKQSLSNKMCPTTSSQTAGTLESGKGGVARVTQNTSEARGLIERLNLTLKREWLLGKDPQTLPELRQGLQEFKSW